MPTYSWVVNHPHRKLPFATYKKLVLPRLDLQEIYSIFNNLDILDTKFALSCEVYSPQKPHLFGLGDVP